MITANALDQPSAWPTRKSGNELMHLAWPFILSNSCWTMQIVLDRVLLSRSSPEDVGAGISAVMLFWSLLTLFQYTTNYAVAFVSQYLGAGRPERIGAVIGQALWFAVFSGFAFYLLVPFAAPIVSLTGHSPNLQHLEVIYFQCLCYSALPFLLTAAATSFFGGLGQSVIVLIINVAGLIVNGALAVVLIFGYFGFKPMGIAGAGWATVAGTSTSALLGLVLLLRPRYIREYGNWRTWGFDRALFSRLMAFGLPQGIGTCLETLAFGLFLIFVGRFGTIDLAATSIASTLNLLAFLPIMGIGQAIEVLISRHLGANDPVAAERAVWTGVIVSLVATSSVALAYVVIPGILAEPFRTQDQPEAWAQVVERVPLLLRFVAIYCFFDCLNVALAFGLRGAGDTRFVTAVSLVLAWPVMVIPSWLMFEWGWGMYWCWGFASAYVILLALVYLVRFLQGNWKKLRVIESEPMELAWPTTQREAKRLSRDDAPQREEIQGSTIGVMQQPNPAAKQGADDE
jgi:MATE family multidrug resistance protein